MVLSFYEKTHCNHPSINHFLSLFISGCAKQKNEFYLGKKYKKEIERIIDDEYLKSIKEIDEVFNEFEKETNPYEKSHILDDGIRYVLTGFYIELYDKTKEYTKLEELETDWHVALEEELLLYFKNNKINMSKINKLNHYADIRQEEIEKRREEIIFPAPEKF